MPFRRAIVQSNYDSIFDAARPGRPAKLTIRLKMALYPLDPSAVWKAGGAPPPPSHLAGSLANAHRGMVLDYDKRLVSCRSWLVSEWSAFKVRFERAVEKSWNDQMFILPTETGGDAGALSDDDFRRLVSDRAMQAHVECALDIELVPMGAIAHAVIEVVHLQKPGDKFRNWMNRISDESVQFAMSPDPRWPYMHFGHISAAHEAGHWLRNPTATLFPHVDRAYADTLIGRRRAKERAKEQYGHTLGKHMALMGRGSLASEYEAGPWMAAIRRHTHMLFGWTYIHRLDFDALAGKVTDRQRRLFP